ncbi:Rossmann-fold NAD(P)-binding domain-containing protein [Paracoccus beibuensis]|uniref:hypothetical protein n=1 Tax=Paracoccus beibuensis TaxID=547602 RepID=UPI00224027D6|nr:hypothetical protein [Paracoccus beibuensis]
MRSNPIDGLRNLATALAKDGSDGIHVGHVVIDGGIAGDKVDEAIAGGCASEKIGLDGIAQAYRFLHPQSRSGWHLKMDLPT